MSEAWRVLFYTDADGGSPVRDFLRALPLSQRRRIGWTIRLLQDSGTTLAQPYAKHLGGGLWELRIQADGDALRCLYVTWTGRRFLILHAFQKKTQKTSPREIDTARRRWADWLARHRES